MKLNVKSLKDVEIGIPVVTAGVYHARFDKVEVKPNKAGTGNNFVTMVKLLDPTIVLHKDGSEVSNKGQFVLTRHIGLVPSADYDPDQKIKEIAVAIKHPEEQDLNVEDVSNKLCMVKVGVRLERKDEKTGQTYPVSNEIERYTPIKEDDTFTAPPF